MSVQVKVGPKMAFTTLGDSHVVPVGTIFQSDNSWLASPNNKAVLIMQEDGNFVLYKVVGDGPTKDGDTFTGEPKWASDTYNNKHAYAKLQNDGNLVVCDSQSKPLWASGTFGIVCVGLFVQDDGNAVLYKPSPAWAAIKSK